MEYMVCRLVPTSLASRAAETPRCSRISLSCVRVCMASSDNIVVITRHPRNPVLSLSACFTAAAVLLAGCGTEPASLSGARPQVTVAAAANLTQVFQAIAPRFEAATGIHPVFSFGSTAQLTQQIENSAPFDLFAAADSSHVDQLEREGKLVPGSRAIYATGILALWFPAASHAKSVRIEDLKSPEIRIIAVARPEL